MHISINHVMTSFGRKCVPRSKCAWDTHFGHSCFLIILKNNVWFDRSVHGLHTSINHVFTSFGKKCVPRSKCAWDVHFYRSCFSHHFQVCIECTFRSIMFSHHFEINIVLDRSVRGVHTSNNRVFTSFERKYVVRSKCASGAHFD